MHAWLFVRCPYGDFYSLFVRESENFIYFLVIWILKSKAILERAIYLCQIYLRRPCILDAKHWHADTWKMGHGFPPRIIHWKTLFIWEAVSRAISEHRHGTEYGSPWSVAKTFPASCLKNSAEVKFFVRKSSWFLLWMLACSVFSA